MSDKIYLDHAASTSLYPEAIQAMQRACKIIGNPSSIHFQGREAKSILDEARIKCAEILCCNASEVIFTSGATESLNLAMIGGYLARRSGGGTVWVSPLSHACVRGAADFLKKHFGAAVCFLPLDKHGFFAKKTFDPNFFKGSALVAVEHGNSEIGLLQPVEKIGEAIKAMSDKGDDFPVFIVDCAASIVTESISFEKLCADFVALSGEKFGGPKGSGILLKNKNTPLEPIFKGSQEFGLRGGTENIQAVAGIAKALELHERGRSGLNNKWQELHRFIRNYFQEKWPHLRITTPEKNFLPHIFHFLLGGGMSSGLFVAKCDLGGLSISAGSACASGCVRGSSVLKNLGVSEEDSGRGVRISLGRETSFSDVQRCLEILGDNF